MADLTNSAKFPDHPDLVGYSTSFEAPVNAGTDYGVQMQGYLTAPVTGDYRFYIASDDQGALWLSTDDKPANKRQIALEPQWNSSRAWVGGLNAGSRLSGSGATQPTNVSTVITLEAGRKYYVEALMKQGGGLANLAVLWQKPGDPLPMDGDPPIPGDYLSSLVASVPASFTQVPTNQAVKEYGTATFSATLTGTPPYDYQWFKNGVAVLGANSPSLTLLNVSPKDSGCVYSLAAGNGVSSLQSTGAVLTVIPDQTPPTLISVEGSATFDRVTILFSEAIDPADATNLTHYAFGGGLGITGASLSGDGKSVLLTTSRQQAGTNYVLTVNGIHDRAAMPNAMAPNARVTLATYVLARGFLRRELWLNVAGSTLADLTNNLRRNRLRTARTLMPSCRAIS